MLGRPRVLDEQKRNRTQDKANEPKGYTSLGEDESLSPSLFNAYHQSVPETASISAMSGKNNATATKPTKQPKANVTSGPLKAASACHHR